MGIVEDMLLPDRIANEGDLERQLNNVMDRGFDLYIRYILANELAGDFLGLGLDPSQLTKATGAADVTKVTEQSDAIGLSGLLGGAAREAGNVLTKSRLF